MRSQSRFTRSQARPKKRKHQEFLDGLLSAVLVPGHGSSFERPIEILFVEEEYVVLGSLGLRMKEQGLHERNGHHFDVLTTHAKPGQPEQHLFFNIDMPWKALEANMAKALIESKKSDGKK